MITRCLFFFLACLLTYTRGSAQKIAAGDWYIISNEQDTAAHGKNCTMHVTYTKGIYHLSHNSNACEAAMPPEGDYKINASGYLAMADEVIEIIGKRLLYNKNGAVEFANLKTSFEDSILFTRAAIMLNHADEIKNKITRKKVLDSCILFINRVLKDEPITKEIYFNRSLIYLKLDEPDSAAHDALKLSFYAPDFPDLHALISAIADSYSKTGWEKYGKVHKYKEAIAVFTRGLLVAPDDAGLWYNIGGAYYSNKQYSYAKDAFKRAWMPQRR